MRPPPPSLYSNFFSSLKQVEKRLKLESPTTPCNISSTDKSIESLSSPIYLQEEPISNTSTSLQESSEPPLAFLSSSSSHLSNPPQQEQQPTKIIVPADGVDDIQLLMQLLGLSDIDQRNKGQQVKEKERVYCECEGGFYEKIVGVKGPKCKTEVDRLESWISYFLHNGECGGEGRMEPLRLAFLLLGKAAFEFEGSGGSDTASLDFPSTIQDFLKYDPEST